MCLQGIDGLAGDVHLLLWQVWLSACSSVGFVALNIRTMSFEFLSPHLRDEITSGALTNECLSLLELGPECDKFTKLMLSCDEISSKFGAGYSRQCYWMI